ncbi:MAG: hypothetical protein V1755_09525 [Chloroflexota bacterium]
MERPPSARQYLVSSLFLMAAGWGGLVLLIFVFQLPPVVWARWGFFALWFTALSGTALPVVYFLNLRFPSNPPAEPRSIVRQALWVGVYGCVLAWLQLGQVMAFWIWMGLAGGLILVEYLIRLRERAHWRPPAHTERHAASTGTYESGETPSWLGGDESPQ